MDEKAVVGKVVDRAFNQGFDTKKALAEAAQVSQPTLNRIMRGQRVNLRTISKLANALKCSPSELMED